MTGKGLEKGREPYKGGKVYKKRAEFKGSLGLLMSFLCIIIIIIENVCCIGFNNSASGVTYCLIVAVLIRVVLIREGSKLMSLLMNLGEEPRQKIPGKGQLHLSLSLQQEMFLLWIRP